MGTSAVVTYIIETFALSLFIRNMQQATRISVCAIAVSKSHEFFLRVGRLYSFFVDDDAYAFTSTCPIFFLRRRKGFDFDDESFFSTTSDTSWSASCLPNG